MLTAVPENIVYLTGYHSLAYFTFQLLVVPLDHPPILLVRGVARHKARIDSCLEHVVGYFDTVDPDEATYRLLATTGCSAGASAIRTTRGSSRRRATSKLVARLGVDELPDCSGLVERCAGASRPGRSSTCARRDATAPPRSRRRSRRCARGCWRPRSPPPPTRRCTARGASTWGTPPSSWPGRRPGSPSSARGAGRSRPTTSCTWRRAAPTTATTACCRAPSSSATRIRSGSRWPRPRAMRWKRRRRRPAPA